MTPGGDGRSAVSQLKPKYQRQTRTPIVPEGGLAARLGFRTLEAGVFFTSITAFRLSGFTLGDLFLIAAIPLAGLAAPYVKKPPAALNSSWIIGLLILIGGILATARALVPDESVLAVARILVLVIVVPWLFRTLVPTTQHLRRIAAYFAAGAGVCGAGTLIQFAGVRIPGSEVTNAGRFTGFAQHVSDTGGITSIGIVVALGLAVTTKSKRARFGLLAAAAGAAIGLVLSGSVSGFIAVGAAFLILIVRRTLKLRHAILIAGLVTATILIADSLQSKVAGALSPVGRVLQTIGVTQGGRYNTSSTRVETYEAAIGQFLQSPIVGVGLDNRSAIADGVFPAHNILVGAAFQGGILLLLGITLALLRPYGRWTKRHPDPLVTWLVAASLSATVFAMTAPSLYNRYLWIPIALLLTAKALSSTTLLLAKTENAPALPKVRAGA